MTNLADVPLTAVKKTSKKPLFTVIIIFALFVVPFVLAWVLYEEQDTFGKPSNNGQLIQPPLDLAKLSLQTLDKKPVDQKTLRGKWLLLYINPNPICDEACQKNIYNIRQIRTATGKEAERVQRAIITFSGQKPDAQLQTLLKGPFAGTSHFLANKQQVQQFLASSPEAKLAIQTGSIYLVDPLGNVMMEYAPKANPSGIFKDLTRLLKVSQIG
jgi:cytochrome oxidase Cu insertion factor (SCO1/SenC/PrrC family)